MNKFEIESVPGPSYLDEESEEECIGKICPYCASRVVNEDYSLNPCVHVACIAHDEGVEYVHPEFTLADELADAFGDNYKEFTIAVTLYFAGKFQEGKVYHEDDLHIDGYNGFFR